MENEKIIQKIKKVLELSKNNPSEEEAKAAALQAQKLLAKYHIDMKEIEDIDLDKVESIDEVAVDVPAKKWKYKLAHIIAKNFRCKHFYYGRGTVVFYGHKTDAEVAAETFKYLFKHGDRKANYERQHSWNSAGVYNAYVSGFCKGIEDELGKQCTALALVVPEDVTDAYKQRSSEFRTMNQSGLRISGSDEGIRAFNNGHLEGRSAIGGRAIAMS